jgi:hypothetical protein
MVELANTQNAEPWFNMPLDASDDYYRNFAKYVHEHLLPQSKVYVEVSNEVWNRQFKQSKEATTRGLDIYPGVTPVTANDYFYADRVRAVMSIWSEVFRDRPSKLVRVLATQAGSVNRSSDALSHKDTAQSVDALAIAPYFGPGREEAPEGKDVKAFALDEGPRFVDVAISKALASKTIADRFGLRLITYEGGPAYVSRNPAISLALKAAEQDPRMYDIYTEFLRRWHNEVGGLYVAFDSVSSQFGHQLYTGQPLRDAPKMRALVNFINAQHLDKRKSKTESR